jgi:hypothetical protein
MGIGVKAIISHRDLALVRNMGGRPGDELQGVHPLQVFGLFTITVADPAEIFIEREPLRRQKRADYVFAHPFGLGLYIIEVRLSISL